MTRLPYGSENSPPPLEDSILIEWIVLLAMIVWPAVYWLTWPLWRPLVAFDQWVMAPPTETGAGSRGSWPQPAGSAASWWRSAPHWHPRRR